MSKKNIRLLRSIRIEGQPIEAGTVLPKSALPDGLAATLCHMSPPKGEETDEPVGNSEGKKRRSEPALPGM